MIEYKEYKSVNPEHILERTRKCCPDVNIEDLKKYGKRRVMLNECQGYLIFEDGKEIGGWIGPELVLT